MTDKPEHWLFGPTLKIATKEECSAPWSGGKAGKYFRCGFCGHRFKVGDKWRGLYTNDMRDAGGNPLVCEDCTKVNKNDTELLRLAWRVKCQGWDKVREEYWSFIKRYDD